MVDLVTEEHGLLVGGQVKPVGTDAVGKIGNQRASRVVVVDGATQGVRYVEGLVGREDGRFIPATAGGDGPENWVRVGVVVDDDLVVAPVGRVQLVLSRIERAAGGDTAQAATDRLLDISCVVVDLVGAVADRD